MHEGNLLLRTNQRADENDASATGNTNNDQGREWQERRIADLSSAYNSNTSHFHSQAGGRRIDHDFPRLFLIMTPYSGLVCSVTETRAPDGTNTSAHRFIFIAEVIDRVGTMNVVVSINQRNYEPSSQLLR